MPISIGLVSVKNGQINEELEIFFAWDPVTIKNARPKSGWKFSIENRNNKFLVHGLYYKKSPSGAWYKLVNIKDDSPVKTLHPKAAFLEMEEFLKRSNTDLLVFHGQDQLSLNTLYQKYGAVFKYPFMNSQ